MIKKSILAASLAAVFGISVPAYAAAPFQIIVPINPGVVLTTDEGLLGDDLEEDLNSWSLAAHTLPNAEVGTEYSFNFSALVETDPVGYVLSGLSWSGDSLPSWLDMDPVTGEATGTPDAQGEAGFSVTANHPEEGAQSQTYSLVIDGVVINVSQMEAGTSHTCAVSTKGAAYCWGQNTYGQLGNTEAGAFSATPVAVDGLSSGVTSIGVGLYHSCAMHNGAVKCWGYGASGMLGNGATASSQVPVSVSGLASGVTALSVGGWHACVIQDGGAKCWGDNFSRTIGDGTGTNRSTPVQVTGLTSGVTAISAGGAHSCAVHEGAAKCWGSGANGRLGHGSTATAAAPADVLTLDSGVTGISAGSAHSCAILTGGALKCWGNGTSRALGNSNSATHTNIVSSPIDVTNLSSGVTQVSAGNGFTCAVHAGAAKCWGTNAAGNIGDGVYTTGNAPTAITVGGTTIGLMSSVTDISAGGTHACAVHEGKAKCWGSAADGRLGDGRTSGSFPVPAEVTF
jgi:alpha-tubulin suppressor-like RCC1 family protein